MKEEPERVFWEALEEVGLVRAIQYLALGMLALGAGLGFASKVVTCGGSRWVPTGILTLGLTLLLLWVREISKFAERREVSEG